MAFQYSITDFGLEPYKITKPIRLIELFAGIGAQAKALESLGVPFEHYHICEFDEFAVRSYNAIHGTDFKTSDIRLIGADDLGIVDTDRYEYILTYSFPCTDLSPAGRRAGMAKGSGTRSGLLWEVERLFRECSVLPQVLLMENVPQVINPDFYGWTDFLEGLGYRNYYKILNAKDYGIPQNWERCYMVSILGDGYYEFPDPIRLRYALRDFLEENIDEKYYLSAKQLKAMETTDYAQYKIVNDENGIASTLLARDYKGPQKVATKVAGIYTSSSKNFQRGPLDGLSRSLKAEQHDAGVIIQRPHGYNKGGEREFPCLASHSFYENNFIADPRCLNPKVTEVSCSEEICLKEGESFEIYETLEDGTIILSDKTTNRGIIYPPNSEYAYTARKLTPLECWRLMGFSDEDFRKAEKVNSNSQLYKQAGNSIVVDVLKAIFGKML